MHDQDTGTLLRRLRLERGLTQRQAAELLGVSAQAVSKWERGQGCPDVGMLPRLAKIFGVSVEGILDGDLLPAAPDGGNMKKIQFYVCPDCGNILTAAAGGQLACCGRRLEPLEVRSADPDHAVTVQEVEEDWYVTFRHPMDKGHYIRFTACVTPPAAAGAAVSEQGSEFRIPPAGVGAKLYSLLLLPRAVPGEAVVRCKERTVLTVLSFDRSLRSNGGFGGAVAGHEPHEHGHSGADMARQPQLPSPTSRITRISMGRMNWK